MTVLREDENLCNNHRPHRALNQAAPLRSLPKESSTWIGSGFSGVTAPDP